MTPPKKRAPAKKTASLKVAPPIAFTSDPHAPLYNEVALSTPASKRPTFERWETHEEFLRRHDFGAWLTTTLRKAIP